MKDIKDYFSSPTKVRKSSEHVDKEKSAQTPSKQKVNTENQIEDNSEKSKISKTEQPRRAKKKRRRKPTDPEIKDVTELLSNNLSLMSPNTSSNEKKLKKVKRSSLESSIKNEVLESNKGDKDFLKNYKTTNIENVKRKSDKSSKAKTAKTNNYHKDLEPILKLTSSDLTVDLTESNSEPAKETQKVNAFHFMMNSRSNVIGQNSDGKTASDQDDSDYGYGGQKSNLNTRKDLFKNWADQKGALKRKREEKEIEKCINHKLDKRAKRLKKLLQVKTDEKVKILKIKEPLLKIKKTAKIFSSSESEDSTDLAKIELGEGSKDSVPPVIVDISEVIEENAQDTIVTISSPQPKKHQKENNLLNFFGVLSKEPKEERIEVFDDSTKGPLKELIKIKMFTPESTKKRTSLLSLYRDRAKSITDESSQESIKAKKHKKKTKKHKYIEGYSQNEAQSTDSLEDFCTSEPKKSNTSIRKSTKRNGNKATQKEDRNNQSKKIANNAIDKEVIRYGSVKRKAEAEIPANDVDDWVKEWDSDAENESDKAGNTPNNKEDMLIENSDIIQPKHCILADDSGDSKSSVKRNLSINNSMTESPAIKAKEKTKSKPCSDENVDQKTVPDDDISLGFNRSLRGSNMKSKRKAKRNIIDDDDLLQNSTGKISKTKKKINMRTKLHESGSEDNEDEMNKTEDVEPQGRVLRPKRTNINYTDFKEKTSKTNKKEHSPVKSSKNDSIERVELLSSDSEYEEAPKKKAAAKMAPVFLKTTPKPKLDPEVAQARKQFLLSGVPESLKKTIEKQKSIEEKKYDVFPSISHVQQKCQSKFWDLPKPDLKYSNITHFDPKEHTLTFHDLIIRKTPYKVNITTEMEPIKHIKSLLNKIKADNPNYPVYKVFRHIYEKSGKSFLRDKKSTRRRSKKSARKSSELAESIISDSDLKCCEMWTDKYKPRSSEEILGNHSGVSALKKWLETWMNYSEEINARGKRKRRHSNSESEFETTDCDSRDSSRLPGNTMTLSGPCGSGKSSAVYAIANELGFNVLELNASSKRTGKRLLQELQEATQSHQVRKNAINFNTENASNKSKNRRTDSDEQNDQDKKKMCILLIEDIDLVFDQDDGFLTSLSLLITTSKRPIILTTTDNSPPHVQKLIAQYEYTAFSPLSLQCLAVWLQILCLVEGLLVDKDDLGSLLEYNKGDARKTLLEVQFWCQSGGQLERTRKFPLQSCSSGRAKTDFKESDEELKIDLTVDDREEDHFIHKHCIGSFEILRGNKEYIVPQYLNLGLLWWNMPSILNKADGAAERLHRQGGRTIGNNPSDHGNVVSDEANITKLNSALSLYEALTLSDSLFKSVHHGSSNEPVIKNWSTDVRDSLELIERTEDSNVGLDMVHELAQSLVNGRLEEFSAIEERTLCLNMSLPDAHERRWRAKQHICDDYLKEPIPLWNALDRSSVALDYLPTLRDIARNEEKRASLNTKRGNRFRHYLRNLNMDFKQSTAKLACNILFLTDD